MLFESVRDFRALMMAHKLAIADTYDVKWELSGAGFTGLEIKALLELNWNGVPLADVQKILPGLSGGIDTGWKRLHEIASSFDPVCKQCGTHLHPPDFMLHFIDRAHCGRCGTQLRGRD